MIKEKRSDRAHLSEGFIIHQNGTTYCDVDLVGQGPGAPTAHTFAFGSSKQHPAF